MVPSRGDMRATASVLGMPVSTSYDMSKPALAPLDKVTLFFDGFDRVEQPSFSLTVDFAQALVKLLKLHLAEADCAERHKGFLSAGSTRNGTELPSLTSQDALNYAKAEKPLADFSPNSWDQPVINDEQHHSDTDQFHDDLQPSEHSHQRQISRLPDNSLHTNEFDRQTTPTSTTMQQAAEFELRQVWVADQERVQRMVYRMSTSGISAVKDDDQAQVIRKKVREINYGSGNNIYQRSRSLLSLTTNQLSPLVTPESPIRLLWDFMAAILLAWDGIHLPMQFFEFKKTKLVTVMDCTVAVYWTLDMVMSCLTGVYIDGKLVMKFKLIVFMYMKTWFVFDLILVAFEWILLLDENTSGSMSAISGLRGFRALRFLRLLRLVKIRTLLSHLQRTINSMYLLLFLGIVKHIMSMLFATHCVAGLWYYIGSLNDDGWVAVLSESSEVSDSFKYLTAFHWGLCSFHGAMEVYPTNTWERLFAVVVVSLGLITFTMFVSSMTQSMLELQSLHAERVKQHHMLCNFLMDRKISRPLCVRIKNYLSHLDRQSDVMQQDQHVKLLRQLPEPLLMEIYAEARAPILLTHILCIDIYEYYPRALLRVCHSAISEQGLQAAQCVFATGDVCNSVLIIESGSLIYVHHDGSTPGKSVREVSKVVGDQDWLHKICDDANEQEDEVGARHHVRRSQWVSESALWVKWEYRGVLVSQTHSRALRLYANEFAQVIGEFERAYVMAALYARSFIEFLNENVPIDILDVPVSDYLGSFKPNMTTSSSFNFEIVQGLHSL